MAKKEDNTWTKLPNPPPRMYAGPKERALVKHVNTELEERIIGQQILYYSLDLSLSNFHDLYGESINKTFLPPIRVYALVDWEGQATETTSYGVDKRSSITVHFHNARLTDDQNVYVRVGDFVSYGGILYEIVETNTPREIFGNVNYKMEISAKCVRARKGVFDAR